MGKFLSIVFSTEPSVDSYPVLERPITEMVIMRGIIYWILLIPIAVYAIQMAYKQTKSNGYPCEEQRVSLVLSDWRNHI